jgi:hypothetical protein
MFIYLYKYSKTCNARTPLQQKCPEKTGVLIFQVEILMFMFKVSIENVPWSEGVLSSQYSDIAGFTVQVENSRRTVFVFPLNLVFFGKLPGLHLGFRQRLRLDFP